MTAHNHGRVSPFGHPRINAQLATPRGISQPPTSFIGPWYQGIHHVPYITWPQRCSHPLYSSQPPHEHHTTHTRNTAPHRPPHTRDTPQPNSMPSTPPITGRTPTFHSQKLLRKEVIQPHLPVRLPCYDLVLITSPTFDGSPTTVRPPASGVTNFHDLTGGVYQPRERIHRSVADLRLLATPTS